VTLPGLGTISYACRPTAGTVAATFTAASLSATDRVSVSENGKTITRATVQPSDPSTPPPHHLSTPFAAYHSLDWLITQATEPHLIIARLHLRFVLTTAHYQGSRFPICDMPHWTANVRTESFAGPVIAVEGIPREPRH
jgi:hypothetical protein